MLQSREEVFAISDAQIEFAGILAYACTIPGTVICGLVLIAYAIIATCYPSARKFLDRVSFRLLVYTLIFNVAFGIAYAATPTSPGPGCNFGAFAVNFTLSFATFFTTCIAINLQLVLVHGVNGRKMEKYYVIGTTVLSLVLNVPTFALHQFGWDNDTATCWYKNGDSNIRLRWIIGTQSFWIALAATIESICSCVVLFWLYRLHASRKSPNTSRFTGSTRSIVVIQDPRYRKIIFRIALYPIVSLVMNYSTVILDLYTTVVGVNTQLQFRLLVLDLILYGLRTLAYGVLAAGDPYFINAIQEIRGSKKQLTGASALDPSGPLTTIYEDDKTDNVNDPQYESHLGQSGITFANDLENSGASRSRDTFRQRTKVLGVDEEDIRDFERQI